MSLAGDGLFRVSYPPYYLQNRFYLPSPSLQEPRHFSPWPRDKAVEDYLLPLHIQTLTGQDYVPIGNFVMESRDGVKIACEMCGRLYEYLQFEISSPNIGHEFDSFGQRSSLHPRAHLSHTV